MFRLFGKASSSIKRIFAALPFFSELSTETRIISQQIPNYSSKSKYILPGVAIAGTFLALSSNSLITKQNLEVFLLSKNIKNRETKLRIESKLLNIQQILRVRILIMLSNY